MKIPTAKHTEPCASLLRSAPASAPGGGEQALDGGRPEEAQHETAAELLQPHGSGCKMGIVWRWSLHPRRGQWVMDLRAGTASTAQRSPAVIDGSRLCYSQFRAGLYGFFGLPKPFSFWPEELKKCNAMDTEANSDLAKQSCFHLCKG